MNALEERRFEEQIARIRLRERMDSISRIVIVSVGVAGGITHLSLGGRVTKAPKARNVTAFWGNAPGTLGSVRVSAESAEWNSETPDLTCNSSDGGSCHLNVAPSALSFTPMASWGVAPEGCYISRLCRSLFLNKIGR